MPTGNCRYPQHHTGPGAGAPVGLVVAIAAGALIVAEWRTVVVVLAVVAALAVAVSAVALLVHSHRAEPYDNARAEPEPATRPACQLDVSPPAASQLASRVAALERQLADRRAIAAPVTHQHLHLHGPAAGDLAAVITRQQHSAAWPAIEEDHQ